MFELILLELEQAREAYLIKRSQTLAQIPCSDPDLKFRFRVCNISSIGESGIIIIESMEGQKIEG